MPFPGILGGFETRQKQFFAYFWSQEKNQKKKISRKIGFFWGKIGFYRKNRRFFADFFFFDFSTAKSFPGPPKSDFSLEKSANFGDFFVPD